MAGARALAIVAALGVGASTRARAGELALAYDAPAGCPDAADLRARIAGRLAGDDVVLGIAVAVVQIGDGFVASIDTSALGDRNDERALASASCDELADAIAVVVARIARQRRLALAPEGHARVIARWTRVDEPPAPATWTFGARLSTLAGVGMLPTSAVGAELVGFVGWRDATFELGRASWLDATRKLPTAGAADRVDVGLVVTTARLAWTSERAPVRAWLVGERGAMAATRTKGSIADTGGARWTGAGGGVGLHWHAGGFVGMVAMAEVIAAVDRVRFARPDGQTIFDSGSLSARFALGVEVGWR